MRRLVGLLVMVALVAAGCGGGGGAGNDLGEDVFGGIGEASGDVDPGSSAGGILEDPTPEASSTLPADSIRIGDAVWQRAIPTDGQCVVVEDDGTIPDRGWAWGSANNDPDVDIKVKQNQDGSLEAEVRSDLMDWIAGQKDGTELTINLDFEATSISGEGLFYNTHTNEWAYGSFQFTCRDGE